MKITETLKFILKSDSMRSKNGTLTTNFKFNNSIGIEFYSYFPSVNKMVIDAELDKKKTNLCIDYDYHADRVNVSVIGYVGYFKKHLVNIESHMCNTEELYFMESTVRNLSPLTLEDYQLISEIYKKYHRIVRYGK